MNTAHAIRAACDSKAASHQSSQIGLIADHVSLNFTLLDKYGYSEVCPACAKREAKERFASPLTVAVLIGWLGVESLGIF